MPSDEYTQAKASVPGQLAGRREALGLTQGEMAKLLGVDQATIVQWEHPGGDPNIPRQLPASVPDFTGRQAELEALTRILDEADGAAVPGAVIISAIGGTAGVGKTALALHWAHRVAHRFPDGQLHVNLRGFEATGDPMPPADAIRGFLDALGVRPERIPRSAEAQAGLYRSLLAGKRMLIVLDNARDEQQVRPLLPASPGTLVLVTSRNQIAGLAAAEGARILSLDALTHSEAVHLLRSRLDSNRVALGDGTLSEIAVLCACLPLALSVAAARIAAGPALPRASELRDAAARLDALDLGDPRASVQTVFSWSYDQLSPEAARMFRLMGLHPGPDISIDAAARLVGTSQVEARRLLHELAHGCLVTERAPGRYAFHDLLRAYAARQARGLDSGSERAVAVGRVLDYYAQSACAAAILLYPSHEMIKFAADRLGDSYAGDGCYSENTTQAQAWLETELPNLTASVALAADSGFDRHAWQIPWFLATHLARRGYLHERIALLRTALSAAMRLEDRSGQAVSNRLLANAYADLRDHNQALEHYKASVGLYKEYDDRLGESKARHGIATVTGCQGRYTEAVDHLERVLQIQQELGHKQGEARTLISLAWVHGALGAVTEARDRCRQALTLATELGNRYLEALAWHGIAYAQQVLGDFDDSAEAFHRALDCARKDGDRLHEADVFAHLGDLRHAHGKTNGAWESWSRALSIFDEIHHPDADQIRSKLAGPALPGDRPFADGPIHSDPLSGLPWCSLVHFSLDIKQPTGDTVQLRRINRESHPQLAERVTPAGTFPGGSSVRGRLAW